MIAGSTKVPPKPGACAGTAARQRQRKTICRSRATRSDGIGLNTPSASPRRASASAGPRGSFPAGPVLAPSGALPCRPRCRIMPSLPSIAITTAVAPGCPRGQALAPAPRRVSASGKQSVGEELRVAMGQVLIPPRLRLGVPAQALGLGDPSLPGAAPGQRVPPSPADRLQLCLS